MTAFRVALSIALTLIVFAPSLSFGAVLFNDDFEIADTSSWPDGITQTNGSISVNTNLPHSGLYSAQHTLVSGTVNTLMKKIVTGAGSTTYSRIFFYVDQYLNVTGDLQILQLLNNASFVGQRLYLRNASGTLYLKVEGSATRGTTAITRNAWHSVEMKFVAGAGTGTVDVYLDASESPEVSATALTLSNADTIRMGCYGTATGYVYFDDAVVSTEAIGSPASLVTVRHPLIAARSGMQLHNTLYGWTSTDKLLVNVDTANVYTKSGSITGVEYAPVILSSLASGNHTLEVQLKSSGDVLKASASETITKLMDGNATVYIDENNFVKVAGVKQFPITPFMQSSTEWNTYWTEGYANMYGWFSGYAETYNATQYQAWLATVAAISGTRSIGPGGRWCNGLGVGQFCSDSGDNANYVITPTAYATAMTDDANVFAWTWEDEPDLGGNNPRVPAADIRAICLAVNNADPKHPVLLNLYGWQPETTRQKGFLYPNLSANIYAFDEYPIIYQDSSGSVLEWVSDMDKWVRYNYNLTPWYTFVEAGIQTGGTATNHGPTAAQLKMEAWLAVIHGITGIAWWGPEGTYSTIPAENHAAMTQFVTDIGALKDVVLTVPPTDYSVTDNQNITGSRIDSTIRYADNSVWIFAARLSEYSDNTTSAIDTTFTVSGYSNGIATVYGEDRTITVTNGVFVDSFAPYAVHIYSLGTELPVATITEPASGGLKSGTITLTATCTHSVGVEGVQWKRSSVNIGTQDTSSPYTMEWNTTQVPNGTYSLRAICTAMGGSTAEASPLSITINNPVEFGPHIVMNSLIMNKQISAGSIVPTVTWQSGSTTWQGGSVGW